ncbi:MAG: diguanylate cyclase [Myxococcales bacterium]|nr:MAG: diguanylate cyclase [Myxococcales bacterium]
MKLCIPVEQDKGLESAVYGHFGSAPVFLVVDTETLACQAIVNTDQHHAHGMCHPLKAIGSVQVDGVVVGGIGMGALTKLNASGVRVFQSPFATVRETAEAMKQNKLAEFDATHACGGHGHQHHHGPGGGHGDGNCGH